MTTDKVNDIKNIYAKAGQSHVFSGYDSLSSQEQEQLIQELSKIADPAALINSCQESIAQANAMKSAKSATIEPLPHTSYDSVIDNPIKEQEYFEIGIDAIAKGKVAVVLMAGGQGTRLGSSSPKGCYDIGLPSHKSLFQIQAERLQALQKMCGSHLGKDSTIEIPWYIMTSKPTYQPTMDFFTENHYFGLSPKQVTFFNQGTLPAFDLKGEKLLLQSESSLVQSPDGNGGLYKALVDNKILDDMLAKNIEHVHMYCVDNVLVKIADPVFIGYSIEHRFQLATKVVRKRDAHESVGLIVSKDGKPNVIEYSEISNELCEEKDSIHPELLKFRSANIVNHYYNIDLLKKNLEKWCSTMPYHIATKKITYFDPETKKTVKPTEPNGIKLEQFIFDVFETVPLEKFGCLEVDRTKEFSPLKNSNAAANDNPNTAKAAYMALGTQWLKKSGAKVPEGVMIEVDSKMSYSGENLAQFSGTDFAGKNGTYLSR
ncbi:UDP-N-acetylglucosamine pyrophosphorylase-like protein [Hanseniaspora osmophila]